MADWHKMALHTAFPSRNPPNEWTTNTRLRSQNRQSLPDNQLPRVPTLTWQYLTIKLLFLSSRIFLPTWLQDNWFWFVSISQTFLPTCFQDHCLLAPAQIIIIWTTTNPLYFFSRTNINKWTNKYIYILIKYDEMIFFKIIKQNENMKKINETEYLLSRSILRYLSKHIRIQNNATTLLQKQVLSKNKGSQMLDYW